MRRCLRHKTNDTPGLFWQTKFQWFDPTNASGVSNINGCGPLKKKQMDEMFLALPANWATSDVAGYSISLYSAASISGLIFFPPASLVSECLPANAQLFRSRSCARFASPNPQFDSSLTAALTRSSKQRGCAADLALLWQASGELLEPSIFKSLVS